LAETVTEKLKRYKL